MTNPAKYPANSVQRLLKGERTIEVYGAQVKISQGADMLPGMLDPWLLEQKKAAAAVQEPSSGAFDLQKFIASNKDPEQLLIMLRNLMSAGIPAMSPAELSQGSLQVDCQELVFWKNTNKLWRFQRKDLDLSKAHPCFIHIHAGGFFAGTPFGVNPMLEYIAEHADVVVFDVDYSLSPEHKYPHAHQECYNAVRYIYEHAAKYHIDPQKIVVGGGSAGANLTAAVTLMAKAEGGYPPIALQVLMNPTTLFGGQPREGYVWDASQFEVAEETRLYIGEIVCPETDMNIVIMAKAYLGNEPPNNVYVSPMLAEDFSGLPQALVFTSELDSLRIQGEFYAGLLTKAGVDVKTTRYQGTQHETLGLFGITPQAEACSLAIIEAIRAL